MNTTPLWVPLLVAAMGLIGTVAGTVGGVLVTQLMANKREQANWTRELRREQTRWSREDQTMTFEHRRVAYVDFYESLRKMMLRAYDHGMGLSDDESDELPEGWQTHAFERLQHLELYASPKVALLAFEALRRHVELGTRDSVWTRQ